MSTISCRARRMSRRCAALSVHFWILLTAACVVVASFELPQPAATAATAPRIAAAAAYFISDLPGASADQGDSAPASVDGGCLELRAPDHDVEVRRRAVDATSRFLRAGAAETGTEGDVRGGVLVEERRVEDAARLADPR